MDVEAVRETMDAAVTQARKGGGPMLVEAKTYRFAGHSRSDAAPYRPEGELEAWRARDPLPLTRNQLQRSGAAHRDVLGRLEERVRSQVESAVAEATAMSSPGVQAMFDNIWTIQPGAAAG